MRVFEVKKTTMEDGHEVYSVTMDKGMVYELRTMIDARKKTVNFAAGENDERANAKLYGLTKAWAVVNRFIKETFGAELPKRFEQVLNGSGEDTVDSDQ